MEPVILITVGKDAPRIITQIEQQKTKPKGNIQSIQDDLDALQRIYIRKIISRAKIEHGLGRVMRDLSYMLGVRCALRFMVGYEDLPL